MTRLLAMNGHKVRLWCREEDGPDALRETRESPLFLPGVKIPDSVEISTDCDPAVEMAVLAVPSHVMRLITERYPFGPETIRVSVAKGVENGTLFCMHEVIRETSGDVPVAVLSGPSHAEEVARDRPSLVVAANESIEVAETVQAAFNSDAFRVYTSRDVMGVELGGSLKNVIAIAAGISDGFDLGDNARAALMTRGLAEMSRLGAAMGADPITFAGLSGMGDLIVTCSSRHSRNHALGERLAKGMSVEEALAASPMVAEGVKTAESANALAEREKVEMPIAHQVYRVLYEGADAREAIAGLMLRDPRPEQG